MVVENGYWKRIFGTGIVDRMDETRALGCLGLGAKRLTAEHYFQVRKQTSPVCN